MKFRPLLTGLETRENPVGPQLMEDLGGLPTPPPPQPPLPAPPTPPSQGSGIPLLGLCPVSQAAR